MANNNPLSIAINDVGSEATLAIMYHNGERVANMVFVHGAPMRRAMRRFEKLGIVVTSEPHVQKIRTDKKKEKR